MTRLPKKRGITQVEEDKSLILRRYAEVALKNSFVKARRGIEVSGRRSLNDVCSSHWLHPH